MGDVMRQLTVEMDEAEMILLEAAANARGIDPNNINKTQLLELLAQVEAATNTNAPAARDAGTVPSARARRLEALMKMHGIWKGDPDKPQDGAAYQQEIRAEWR